MTQLSYTVPVAGTDLNSVADPEIATALTAIKSAVNGGLDTGNLSSTAAITRGQLAGGGGNLVAQSTVGTSTSMADGNLYITTAGSITMTLPSAASNATVGIIVATTATGAAPVTVSRGGSATIYGLGLSAVTSFTLGAVGAAVTLQSNGTDWFITAGQRDTGWVTFSLPASWTSASFGDYAPASRTIGDCAFLRGSAKNTTGGSATFTATLGASFRPAATEVQMPNSISPVGASALSVASDGTLTVSPIANNGTVFFDGISYSLVS